MDYIKAKSIVSKSKNPAAWFGTEYNMNIYRGCCHGCIYCDSRSDCYRVENFDTVRAKENALEIIRGELSRKIKRGVVATGAMSDPYNPFEAEHKLTRHALELICAYGFGVGIATKSALITRDLDILQEINAKSPVIAKITITCANDELSRIIEPNVSPTSDRLAAVKRLSSAGIFTGILLMPVLPFILDNVDNISSIVEQAYENGAKFIYPVFGVTLRSNQREYFYENLDLLFPGYKYKYIKTFGNKYSCYSQNVRRLWGVFATMCNERGILFKMQDIISAYKVGKQALQLDLFGEFLQ